MRSFLERVPVAVLLLSMVPISRPAAGRISQENVWMDTATVLTQLQEPAAAHP